MNPNPELGHSRVQFAKHVQLIAYIDDIYDVYGTLDEIELYDAIERFVSRLCSCHIAFYLTSVLH